MNPSYYGIAEIAFTGLVALGIGVWQLVSVSREQARDRRAAAARRASEAGARHAIGEHVPDDR